MPNISQWSPEVFGVLSFWREACDGSTLPHFNSLSGSNLRRWVGDVSVLHLHEGPKRFFVSLHGANVARHIGPDFNKKYLEDMIPSLSLDFALAPYEESIKRQVPTYAIMLPTLKNGLHSKLERLVLPFCGDDNEVIERFLVWVAPNDRESGQSKSIYDDKVNGERCDSFFSLYQFDGDKPVEIDWCARTERTEAKPITSSLQKLSGMFSRSERYGFR